LALSGNTVTILQPRNEPGPLVQAGISSIIASVPDCGIGWWWRSGTVTSARKASRKASISPG
jgi:hypothetical protein